MCEFTTLQITEKFFLNNVKALTEMTPDRIVLWMVDAQTIRSLWKSVQKITLLAADEHSWLFGANTEKEFCLLWYAQHVGVRSIHIWICGCGRREASMNRTNVGFSARWYLTDRAYCEDIKNVLQHCFPLVLVQLMAAMRGTCGCQTPTVRVDVFLTQKEVRWY